MDGVQKREVAGQDVPFELPPQPENRGMDLTPCSIAPGHLQFSCMFQGKMRWTT